MFFATVKYYHVLITDITGRNYYNTHGETWPGQGDPEPGFRYPSPGNDAVVVLMMALFLILVRIVFEK